MDQWLPQDTMEKLAAIKPHRSGEGPDIPRWRWEKYNDFSVRSAYKTIHVVCLPSTDHDYVVRVPHHLSTGDVCPLCNRASETVEHVLRSCPRARRGWETIVRREKLHIFFSLPITEWLQQCTFNAASIGYNDVLWATHFSIFCWLIRKQRYAAVFSQNTSQSQVWIEYGNQLVELISDVQRSNNGIRLDNSDTDNRCLAAWHPPSIGWVKANCDGAVNPRNDKATVGGVIRDENGVHHVQRCKNVVADKLASLSRDKKLGEVLLDRPPLRCWSCCIRK
ncbi:hypothetical protein V6N11_033699 [Hibiscus sabdariffa]|uniref:Reverse transcriptase zinc-binding domain-containing protein n=1 Tax=Hibiscus sabdariffa TaxID=183260 RepID=A0ABR1Z960_9ROSI